MTKTEMIWDFIGNDRRGPARSYAKCSRARGIHASTGTRQLGPRTTRTETSQSVNEDESARKRGLVGPARMLRQLGPYEKTTRTINNYCCLIYFFLIKLTEIIRYSLTSVKSILKCKKKIPL